MEDITFTIGLILMLISASFIGLNFADDLTEPNSRSNPIMFVPKNPLAPNFKNGETQKKAKKRLVWFVRFGAPGFALVAASFVIAIVNA